MAKQQLKMYSLCETCERECKLYGADTSQMIACPDYKPVGKKGKKQNGRSS